MCGIVQNFATFQTLFIAHPNYYTPLSSFYKIPAIDAKNIDHVRENSRKIELILSYEINKSWIAFVSSSSVGFRMI